MPARPPSGLPSPALVEEWDDLADRLGAEPWSRPGWFVAFHSAFGRGRLEVFTVRRGGRLVAVAPFERIGNHLIAPSNYHTPVFTVLGVDDEARAELVERVLAQKARRVQAAFVPGDDDPLGRVAERRGHRVLRRALERSPYVDTTGSWEEYAVRRSSKMLREVERRRRRLQERGDLTVEIEDGSTGLDRLLDEGLRVEGAAWKAAGGTAIASGADTEAFYRQVAVWAAARSILRLAFLRLDGRPLAFDFAIEDAGRHSLLKTGYDPEFRNAGVAVLLRRDMIARAFRLGLASYEFLGADEAWKMEWCRDTRERVLIQAFRNAPGGYAEWLAFAHGRPAAKRVLSILRR